MDINATLKELRDLAQQAERLGPLTPEESERFAELFNVLDVQMSNQGFLPEDWARGRRYEVELTSASWAQEGR